jgi:hypothetical protein
VLREIAEYPNSFGPLGPTDERIETDRYTLCMGLSTGALEPVRHSASPW